MKAVILLTCAFLVSVANAKLEPNIPKDDADEGDFCFSCATKTEPVHSPSDVKKLPTHESAPKPGAECGKRCEELIENAKQEGMRCPHEWAHFAAAKHGQRQGADACKFYRSIGKDPTQWSKGLCATSVYDDFIKTGIPVLAKGAAHEWASMLNQPQYHMKKLNITDPAKAPRGTVLVYSSKAAGRYGHIEVAMGNEFCSDYCYPVNFITKAPGEKGKLIGAYLPEDI